MGVNVGASLGCGSCKICGEMYMEVEKTVNHVRNYHFNKLGSAMEFACPGYGCNQAADTKEVLIAHMQHAPSHKASAALPHDELFKFIRPKNPSVTSVHTMKRGIVPGPSTFNSHVPPPPMGVMQPNQQITMPFANQMPPTTFQNPGPSGFNPQINQVQSLGAMQPIQAMGNPFANPVASTSQSDAADNKAIAQPSSTDNPGWKQFLEK